MPMNNRILRPLARPLLLDAVPGAAAAYSLRQLSNAYTGPVVTVRRSSDDAEADFKASEIDDGTLTAFCGAGDGLVKTWFDQSGNGNDATQTVSLSQPSIVSSGSLVLVNGKPAVLADSSSNNQFMSVAGLASFNLTADFTKVSVMKVGVDRVRDIGFGRTTSGGPLSYVDIAQSSSLIIADFRTDGFVLARLFGTYNTNLNLFFYQGLSTLSLFQNGATKGSVAKPAGSVTINNVSLFATESQGGNFNGGTGYLLETVLYPSDQSANRQRIEGDINRHFGIF